MTLHVFVTSLCIMSSMLWLVSGFEHRGKRLMQSTTLFSSSYEDMLRKAQNQKLDSNLLGTPSFRDASPSVSARTTVTHAPLKEVIDEKKRGINHSSNINKRGAEPPFTDEMYENLKYVITKITARIKSDTCLSKDELTSFRESVDKIINDAKEYETKLNIMQVSSERLQTTSHHDENHMTSSPSLRSPPANKDSSFFESFQGFPNTWYIANMSAMSTDEYYSALNKRNTAIQLARRQEEGVYSMDSFLSNLSRKRDNP